MICYPRIDIEQSRPRTPSFYGLEMCGRPRGSSPGSMNSRAVLSNSGAARLGWPAPFSPLDAIDAAEHDLALLHSI